MTALQLNKRLFSELSAIADDEAKMRQAVAVLHLIAIGKPPLSHCSVVEQNQKDKMTDAQWETYFADKPAVSLPEETDTKRFVNGAKGRTIKQMKQWL